MAKRERRVDRLPEGWFKTIIEAYDIKTTVESMMQAELEASLGYVKNGSKNKTIDNSRNGTSSKTRRSDLG